MQNWDDRERHLDNDEIQFDDEQVFECEEFTEDKFIYIIVNSCFHWYDHEIGRAFESWYRSDIPDDVRFVEIILSNDRRLRIAKEFVIYYDENHKPITTAIHIGTYNMDEDLYLSKKLDGYLSCRRADIIKNYICNGTIIVSKSLGRIL